MSDANNMSNATLIKWNDAKQNAEFLRIRSDGSFEIQGGAPTLFVLGQLVHAFLKQQDRIKWLEQENDALRADLLLWDKAGIGFTTEDKP